MTSGGTESANQTTSTYFPPEYYYPTANLTIMSRSSTAEESNNIMVANLREEEAGEQTVLDRIRKGVNRFLLRRQ